MVYKLVLLCLMLLVFIVSIKAQEQEQIESDILNDLELSEANEDFAERIDELASLKDKPLDLNRVNEEELNQLFFLSAEQVIAFFTYRQKAGPFLSIYELQSIPGFDLHTINLILPYVKISSAQDVSKDIWELTNSRSRGWVMGTYGRILENQEGYIRQGDARLRYLGSADKTAFRFRWNQKDKLLLSINLEKDAGEPFSMDSGKLSFDHYSGSVYYRDLQKGKHLIVGDYHVQLGQGLMIWTGSQFANRNSLAPVLQQPIGIRPHTGMMESKYLRGAAGSWKIGKLTLVSFLSYLRQTGRIEEAEDGSQYIRSMQSSGLHRTTTELKNRASYAVSYAGSAIMYNLSTFKIGLGVLHMELDKPYSPPVRNYNQNRFRGRQLNQVQMNYQYNWKNLLFYGEAAHSIGSGWANYHGVSAALGRAYSLNLRYRNYGGNYQQTYAQSFQAHGTLGNETGFFGSFGFHPNRKISWVSSFDYVKFAQPLYRVDLPSAGYLLQSQLMYSWYKRGHVRFRYQYKWYQQNFSTSNKNFTGLANALRQQFRLQFRYQLTERFGIANQLEAKFHGKDAEQNQQGFLVYQDVSWRGLKNSWQSNFRISWFDVNGYDARIFTYECDLLYAFSFPSFYRQGFRTYLNQKWRISKNFDCWLRYALTWYPKEESIGSGLDKIIGNKKSDIKFQIRYQWK